MFAYKIAPMSQHWSINYARHVTQQLRISPSALAAKINKSSTTLTRPMNNPNHKHALGRDTLDAIARESGIPYEPFREASGEAPSEFMSEDFEGQLGSLSPSRRQRVLEYLADQRRLHAQEMQEQASDDPQAAP